MFNSSRQHHKLRVHTGRKSAILEIDTLSNLLKAAVAVIAQITLNPFQSINIRSMWLPALLAAVVFAFSLPEAHAENRQLDCNASSAMKDKVVRIIDSHTVETATGLVIKLASIEALNTQVSGKGRKNAGLIKRSRKLLAQLILNKNVVIKFVSDKSDRYGRRIAHIFIPTLKQGLSTWVQAEMIKKGLARVFPNTRKASCVTELLKYETEARLNKTGLWKSRIYQVIQAQNLKSLNRSLGRLQLIEGRVHSVAVRRSRTYINFSKDWSRDFTVTINRRVHKLFTQKGLNVQELTGKLIRVRGWLDRHNGPTIKVYHVGQVEILK